MLREEEQKAVRDGVRIFNAVYREPIDEETFTYKHFGNPTRMDVPYIVEYHGENPVAMRWMMKNEFLCDGEGLCAVQSSDDAVLPDARGLLFLKIRKKAAEMMKTAQTDFEYGCFSHGPAMEIAEKVGEEHVLDLNMARLFLRERKHRWKRFDIPYPRFVSALLMKRRRKNLMKIADPALSVGCADTVSFSEHDYRKINGGDSLHIERNAAYYEWKLSRMRGIRIVTARKDGELWGFLIVHPHGDRASVVDWDVFGEEKTSVLSSMLLPICGDYQYIDVPCLNASRGEMNLFTGIGAKDLTRLWAPICICVKPITAQGEIAKSPEKWKYRYLDVDYFLNESPAAEE